MLGMRIAKFGMISDEIDEVYRMINKEDNNRREHCTASSQPETPEADLAVIT